MKYLEYSYVVDKPITQTFDYIINLQKLQQDINYFEKGELSANAQAHNEIGKCYYLQFNHNEACVECRIELVKIDPPKLARFEYTYKLIEKNGEVEEGSSFLPWSSMSCIMGLEDEQGKTRVTTLMYANDVDSFLKKCLAKFLSFINSSQQKKMIKRLIAHINSNDF